MTSAAVDTAGPVEDARRSHDRSLDAFRDAVVRTSQLWRAIDNPDARAPRLDWTAAETAAHVVGDLRDYTTALTRHRNGYMTHANPPTESPSKLSTKVNARHLEEVPSGIRTDSPTCSKTPRGPTLRWQRPPLRRRTSRLRMVWSSLLRR